MKTNKSKIAKLMLGFTTIAIAAGVLCLARSAHAQAAPGQSSASGRPPHGGGSGGGGSGGGLPYPTASTVSQLIADINYANSAGGAITINLSPGATFNLKSANNTTDSGNGLPVIGGTKALALTIVGNGATIARIAVINRYYIVQNPFRLFDVAPGASLTLDQVTLKGGWSGSGGAILNRGTLNVINGCTLSDNTGAIYNNGGTVTVRDSTFSGNNAGSGAGIYNVSGTLTVTDSAISGNGALYNGGAIYNVGGAVTLSHGAVSGNSARFGGGIYNSGGTVTMSNGSTLSDNVAFHADYPWGGGDGGGIYNSAGTLIISSSNLSGNSADPYFGSGGGTYNDASGTVTVANSSHITGNTSSGPGADVENLNVLYLDGTSTIGILDGNSATPL